MATYNKLCQSILVATADKEGECLKATHLDVDVIKALDADVTDATSKPTVAIKNGNWERTAARMANLRRAVSMSMYLADGWIERLEDPSNDFIVSIVSEGRFATGAAMMPHCEAKRNEMSRMLVAVVQLERTLWLAFEGTVPSYVTTDLHRFWARS